MTYPYELQKLPFDYAALEPSLSRKTMEFHHDKHFQTYVNNLNDALAGENKLQKLSLEDLLANLDQVPQSIAAAVRNNGGGVYNHRFYFEALTAPHTVVPSEYMTKELVRAFGSVEQFAEQFKKAASAQFGSGWAWLVVEQGGHLKIVNTANQDTPLKDRMTPLLTIDVWEHAYYLDYQNRRADYINQYMEIVHWSVVEKRLRDYYIGNMGDMCCRCHG